VLGSKGGCYPVVFEGKFLTKSVRMCLFILLREDVGLANLMGGS